MGRKRRAMRKKRRKRKTTMGLLSQQVFLAQEGTGVPGLAPSRVHQAARAASCLPMFWGHVAVGGA